MCARDYDLHTQKYRNTIFFLFFLTLFKPLKLGFYQKFKAGTHLPACNLHSDGMHFCFPACVHVSHLTSWGPQSLAYSWKKSDKLHWRYYMRINNTNCFKFLCDRKYVPVLQIKNFIVMLTNVDIIKNSFFIVFWQNFQHKNFYQTKVTWFYSESVL
jgi:hypothetical protein